MTDSDGTNLEYPPLSAVLAKHYETCSQCQASEKKKPVAIAGTPVLCSKWFAILRAYADHEGEVNNIVGHDEYGNSAANRHMS